MLLPRSLALLAVAAAASTASASLALPFAWSPQTQGLALPQRAPVWTHNEFPVDDVVTSTDRAGVVDVRVWNKQNSLDYVEVDIGTPPQRLRLAPLLHDNPTWVFAAPYGAHHVYNHSQSSTFDASASGATITLEGLQMTVAKDRATIGDVSGLESDWVFAELTDFKRLPPVWKQVPYDGFLSFGIPGNDVPALVPSLARAGVLAEPVLAFALRKNANGVLSLGGVNPQHFRGDITYIDTAVDSKLTWAVALSGVDLIGTGRQLKGGKLAFYGGMSGVFGSRGAVAAAMKEIEAVAGPCEMMQSLHICSCEKLPSLTFQIGEGSQRVALTIARADYSHRVGPDKCFVALIGLPELETVSVDWVVGRQALTDHYAVFDYGNDSRRARVGFAKRA
ncbi:hypothetical protein PINS_up005275 [Pythium insidiosum]|nr:hypothetical protein PINS_up005275 [Pythium insidiosum]